MPFSTMRHALKADAPRSSGWTTMVIHLMQHALSPDTPHSSPTRRPFFIEKTCVSQEKDGPLFEFFAKHDYIIEYCVSLQRLTL